MPITFQTGRNSIYYYDKSKNVAFRFKYATGKIYYLPMPASLAFIEDSTFLWCIPTTNTYDAPRVGTIPEESWGEYGNHRGHEIVEVDLDLTEKEQGVIDNLLKFTKTRIYNMGEVFKDRDVDYAGEIISNSNQRGPTYAR